MKMDQGPGGQAMPCLEQAETAGTAQSQESHVQDLRDGQRRRTS